jgi:alcohol dehydrogenase class IV
LPAATRTLAFTCTALPMRVVFGSGVLSQLLDEASRLGITRALVLATPPQRGEAERVAALLGSTCAGVFAEAAMHTPLDVTERAMALVAANRIDGVVAIGGGSAIGLGKAIALRTDLPQLAVPTTYAGSEMTPILGETAQGEKRTQRSPRVLPETVIYDVDLTLSLPPQMSAVSGLNAIAHAVEALYAEDGNPITSLMAEEAIGALAQGLPCVIADPADRRARERALYGAWLAGACLGAVGMALHHKLCHTLGGLFELPHAETHAVILAHAAAYNANAASDAMARVARALGAPAAPAGLRTLAERLAAPTSLRDLGMPEAGIERVTAAVLANPYWNPAPLAEPALRALLQRAWRGDPPG